MPQFGRILEPPALLRRAEGAWHPLAMTDVDLDAPLTEAEFQSLEDLAVGFMRRSVLWQHEEKLITLGYAIDSPGGLSLTEAGEMRIAKGR